MPKFDICLKKQQNFEGKGDKVTDFNVSEILTSSLFSRQLTLAEEYLDSGLHTQARLALSIARSLWTVSGEEHTAEERQRYNAAVKRLNYVTNDVTKFKK